MRERDDITFDYVESSRRLRKLREDRHISHATLAKATRINEQTLKNYEQAFLHGGNDCGVKDRTFAIAGMKIEYLYRLAKYFDVSTDYILGISEIQSRNAELSTAADYFGLTETSARNLRYIKENGGSNLKYINLLLSVRGFHYALDYIGKAVAMYEKRQKEAGDNIEAYEQMERSFDALTDHFNYFNLQKGSTESGTLSAKRFISFYKQEAINIIQHLVDCIVDGRIK